jgi:hypothetical protein
MLGKVVVCIVLGLPGIQQKQLRQSRRKVMGAIYTGQPELSKSCIRGTLTVAIGIKVAKK